MDNSTIIAVVSIVIAGVSTSFGAIGYSLPREIKPVAWVEK